MNEGAAIPAATPGPPTIPSPRFDVLDAEEVRHAAAPLLRFAGHVTEPEGREVYTIALSVQIMIDPARRRYDDDTKERLVDLFGEPERWSATTHSFLWAEVDVLLPAFTGATGFRIPLPASYDLEVAAAKYLYALPDGHVPLTFNFTGTIFYRGEGGRMQIGQVPWNCSARYELPVVTWSEMMQRHYPGGNWIRVSPETMEALARRRTELGTHSLDDTVARALEASER